MRVLIIAHGHPDFAKGGAELVAYQMFIALRRRGEDAWFLAAHREQSLAYGGTPFSTLREREILWFSPMTDYFLMAPPDRRLIWKDFQELLERLQPEVIHFHHYLHLGVSCILQAAHYRQTITRPVRIILTLHEYLAICANDGQMIMRQTQELCTESSPPRCAYCFRDISKQPEDFFLRERLFRACLARVDAFVAPSHFLKQVYVRWGLAEERITVIENGQPPVDKLPPRVLRASEMRGEFAYFGQINQFKGLDVLLAALVFLPKAIRKRIRVQVFGGGIESQPETFQQTIAALRKQLGCCVVFHGSYRPEQLPGLLAMVDTVVVPSIWWENSPLVIQEAFKYGRPVICSDIGGMREKVRHEVDGWRFVCRSPASLAEAMMRTLEPETWDKLHRNTPVPVTIDRSLENHQAIYSGKMRTDVKS